MNITNNSVKAHKKGSCDMILHREKSLATSHKSATDITDGYPISC